MNRIIGGGALSLVVMAAGVVTAVWLGRVDIVMIRLAKSMTIRDSGVYLDSSTSQAPGVKGFIAS
ncbi:hypothetical protein ACUN9V_13570 [Salinicola sp. V024]|uniref:hypothetical protein n=1 Tax=Salinicola TaxID=404432 RepID=UPI003F44785E